MLVTFIVFSSKRPYWLHHLFLRNFPDNSNSGLLVLCRLRLSGWRSVHGQNTRYTTTSSTLYQHQNRHILCFVTSNSFFMNCMHFHVERPKSPVKQYNRKCVGFKISATVRNRIDSFLQCSGSVFLEFLEPNEISTALIIPMLSRHQNVFTVCPYRQPFLSSHESHEKFCLCYTSDFP